MRAEVLSTFTSKQDKDLYQQNQYKYWYIKKEGQLQAVLSLLYSAYTSKMQEPTIPVSSIALPML